MSRPNASIPDYQWITAIHIDIVIYLYTCSLAPVHTLLVLKSHTRPSIEFPPTLFSAGMHNIAKIFVRGPCIPWHLHPFHFSFLNGNGMHAFCGVSLSIFRHSATHDGPRDSCERPCIIPFPYTIFIFIMRHLKSPVLFTPSLVCWGLCIMVCD